MKSSTEALQYLFKKGHENIKFLLNMSGIPRRTIYNNLKKFKLHGNLIGKEESGIRTKFNTNDRRRLSLLVKYQNTATASDLRMKMVDRGSPEVTSRTTRNYLHKSGFNLIVPKSISFLTPQHEENRIAWCEQHMRTRWNRWIFSDESRFELYYANNKWPVREVLTSGSSNIASISLVPRDIIILPPLHIKLELMKQFCKSLRKEGKCWKYLCSKFLKMSETKLNEGIFVDLIFENCCMIHCFL